MLIVLSGAKKLSLNFPAATLMALLVFVLSNTISRTIFILSRIYLHHDFEFQGRVFYFFTNQKVSIGFLLAIILAVPLGAYVYDLKDRVGKYFDLIMLAYLSLFFSRLGGAFSRYHPGKITDATWGTFYLGHYRHEPSLYEAISLLIIFFLSVFILRKIKTDGLLALIILAWVSLSRIITDFFRSDDLLPVSVKKNNGFETSNYRLDIGLTLNQIAYSYFVCFHIIFVFLVISYG
jgi:prolipoprotein diacylglyceryltransferase